MSATTPTTEPTGLIAGDTAKWLKTLADYPADEGWVLSYTLINSVGKISFSASASGADHLVNVAAATTAGWAAGAYSWRSQVSQAGEVYTLASGSISVAASFGAATLDARSFARVALAQVEAYLADANNLSAAKYEIAGRSLERHGIDRLLALRDRLLSEVAREDTAQRAAQGLASRSRVMVRFGP